MNIFLAHIQEDTLANVGKLDTLSESYAQKWDAMSKMDHASPLIQTAASHDLIFIVLGVSLIIWFILLFFIVRLDKKVSNLEEQVTKEKTD